MAEKLVAMVKPDGVSALEPSHPCDKIRVWSFKHHVIMVAHEAISMHLPAGFLARFGQRLNEVLPINVIQKDVLTPISSAHDVVHRTGIFNPQLARHG